MTKKAIHCDLCDEAPALSQGFVLGYCTGADGSQEADVKILDLCHQHMQSAAIAMHAILNPDERQRVYSQLRGRM